MTTYGCYLISRPRKQLFKLNLTPLYGPYQRISPYQARKTMGSIPLKRNFIMHASSRDDSMICSTMAGARASLRPTAHFSPLSSQVRNSNSSRLPTHVCSRGAYMALRAGFCLPLPFPKRFPTPSAFCSHISWALPFLQAAAHALPSAQNLLSTILHWATNPWGLSLAFSASGKPSWG